ncbi:MAG: hypothetical protein IT371_27140 [Deltaproteobacteria bacterium]|nr:hypothetical protein [Deltaproteobacteria bacterium]
MELRVAILATNPVAARAVARVIRCGGATVDVVTTPEELGEVLSSGTELVGFDANALPAVLPFLQLRPSVQAFLWASESVDPLLEPLLGAPQVNHVFGLRYPDAPPRPWELLSIIRRRSGGLAPPLGTGLDWGAWQREWVPASTADRDQVVSEVEELCRELAGVRVATTMGEVAHELLMNAMYDAPVDGQGQPLFAHQRTTAIELAPNQRPRLLCGCDGNRLLLAVNDPFGRLRREHVFGGLHRATAAGTLDRSGGGAGLGMMMLYRAATLLFFDVVPGSFTQVTVVLELDVPPRDLRHLPRSIHVFSPAR